MDCLIYLTFLFRKMHNLVSQITFASVAAAFTSGSQDILPKFPTAMQVTEVSHSENTRDKDGKYKHPFLNAP